MKKSFNHSFNFVDVLAALSATAGGLKFDFFQHIYHEIKIQKLLNDLTAWI